MSPVHRDGDCTSSTREALAFTGDLATVASASGDHFLGTENPNFVIGFDTTGSHNVGQRHPARSRQPPRGRAIRLDLSRRRWAERLATAHADLERLLLRLCSRHGAVGSACDVLPERCERAPHPTTSRSPSTRLPTRSAAASPCATSPAMTAPPRPMSLGSATQKSSRTARPISTTSTTPRSKASPGLR